MSRRAGVHQLAGKMEHWLESKGPLDDPRHEQGRQTLLEIARGCPKAMAGEHSRETFQGC